jgi:hypothetical protein
MYAKFSCVTFWEQVRVLRETGIEADEPLGDLCEIGHVDLLPVLGCELPECPGCNGPMQLVEVLQPVPG